MKRLTIFFFITFSCNSLPKDRPMINGNPIVCDKEAYNCPSYKGKYQSKRLKICTDVKIVFKYCKGDPHDLDRDKDGIPCEEKCG